MEKKTPDYIMPHECPECNWQCICQSQPCSCCSEDNQEEQISERRVNLISSREYWTALISNEMWNREYNSVDNCDTEAEKIVSDYFMKAIKELSGWQSKYTKLEEENKNLKSCLHFSDNCLSLLKDENSILLGKVKELEEGFKLACKCINVSPDDPDIYPEQLQVWAKFTDWKKSKGIEF